MSINCNARGRIFLDGAPEEWAALEQHAKLCAACADEIRRMETTERSQTVDMREYRKARALARIENSLAHSNPPAPGAKISGARLGFLAPVFTRLGNPSGRANGRRVAVSSGSLYTTGYPRSWIRGISSGRPLSPKSSAPSGLIGNRQALRRPQAASE